MADLKDLANSPNIERAVDKLYEEAVKLRAQLATATERIGELEKEKAQAYRIVAAAKGNTETAEADRDELREAKEEYSSLVDSLTEHNVALTDALRPMVEQYKKQRGQGFVYMATGLCKQAAALIGDDKEDGK